jgi:hypothetical protein
VDENKISASPLSIIRQKCNPDSPILSTITIEFNGKCARILALLLEFVEGPRGCDNYTTPTNVSEVFCIVLHRNVLVAG